MEVAEYQMKIMKHALGLDRKRTPYRNYYFTNANDNNWSCLIEKELAAKSSEEPNQHGSTYFWLTKQGVEFVTGKKISEAKYREL